MFLKRFKEYQAQGGKDTIDEFLSKRGYNDIESVLNDPIYSGQIRVIPKDQLVEATEWLNRKLSKKAVNVLNRLRDTRKLSKC